MNNKNIRVMLQLDPYFIRNSDYYEKMKEEYGKHPEEKRRICIARAQLILKVFVCKSRSIKTASIEKMK